MIDEYRHLIINDEEYEHIIKQFNKEKHKLVNKIMEFRNFTHWKYEMSLWFHFKDADDFVKIISDDDSITKNFSFDWNQKERLGNKEDEGMNFVVKFNLLIVSADELRCRITIQSPSLSVVSEFKNGIMIRVFYHRKGPTVNMEPCNESDKVSASDFGLHLSNIFIMILFYKLWAEENHVEYKMFKKDTNIVRIKGLTAFNDMILESEKYQRALYKLYAYPLNELTVITEREFGSTSGKAIYGIQYAHYGVVFNDDDMYIVHLKLYYESVSSKKHLVLDSTITGLKDDEGQCEVQIHENNLPIDETMSTYRNSDDYDKDMSIDDFMNTVHKQQAELKTIYHFTMFQYLMFCMAQPKKTIDKDVKSTKKHPNRNESHKQLREAVTVLIKDTGYIPPRKPIMNPGSGSKHSYEYERRGCWCTIRKTGTRYWRKSSTCCQGRGPKAVHVYDVNEENVT